MQKARILFIGGFPSGGTDLTKNIVNAHPDIHISGEMPFIYFLSKYGYFAETLFKTSEEVTAFKTVLIKLDKWKNLENINFIPKQYPITIEDLLHNFFSNSCSLIYGNKTPQNSENIEGLLRIFPEALFLIVVRDVRDIALSWRKKWGKDMLLCAQKWNDRMKKMVHTLDDLPAKKYHLIFYEQLVDHLPKNAADICTFLSIPPSEKMSSFHEHVEKIIDGKINYGKKIVSSNYNKWEKHLNPKDIKRIEEVAFDMLTYFGYEVKYAKSSKQITLYEKLAGYRKDIYAAFFFGNKFSKENTLKKRFTDLSHQVSNYFIKFK
jgi:Sulfotransferase family